MSSPNKKDLPILMSNTDLSKITLTKSQQKAKSQITDWFYSRHKNSQNQVFRLGSPAGYGKTTLVKYVLDELKLRQSECYVVAYTGQAVNVLRQNGIYAKTIHSTFMEQYEEPLKINGKVIYRRGIEVMVVKFRPKKRIPSTVRLIVCDEASFLPADLENIIKRYDVPILEVGDPFQLPPVAGKQCFHMENLDFILTEVVRQTKDSEILDLATRLRNGDDINVKKYHDEVRFLIGQKDSEDTFYRYYPFFTKNDIILTVNNTDREKINNIYRETVLKTHNPYPIRGERLICRRNEWNTMLDDFPLTNGTQGYARNTIYKSDINRRDHSFLLDFKPAFFDDPKKFYDGLICDADYIIMDYNHKKDITYQIKRGPMKFEYAHAITTHLSQGSTYDSIVFVDRYLGYFDSEYAARLRYTAITRARKRVVYILNYNYPDTQRIV